ncbi:MAG: TIGR00725 family protein [Egibacteraceae bacterium]
MPERMVAVVGAGEPDEVLSQVAEAVGAALAQVGVTVVCGGLGGVMAAVCRGAKAHGGRTVGILPGQDPATANPWVDVALPTGFGEARNALVVRAAQAVIAVGGGYGTLSEIALALKAGIPVIGLGTWDIPGVQPAADPREAVERLTGGL